MEIRDLIIDTTPTAVEQTKKGAVCKPTYNFEVAVCSGCDFAIRRTTSKTESLLCIMPSQGLFYIKDSKGVTPLSGCSEQVLKKFLVSTSTRVPVACNWISHLDYDMVPALLGVIAREDLQELARKGLLFANASDGYYGYLNASKSLNYYREYQKLYVKLVEVLRGLYSVEEITNKKGGYEQILKSAEAIRKVFGLDNAYDFIAKVVESGDYAFGYYNVERLLRDFNFEYKRFRDYILYDSVWQGYTERHRFLDDWIDYLTMCSEMGKVKEKYPENLFQEHARAMRRYEVAKADIDARKWEKIVPTLKSYEYEGSKFRIISPKTPVDMVDEASQQHNCLKSYIDSVADGRTKIFFMRRNDAPDQSLVTIEVHLDDSIGQVYAAGNRQPTRECKEFVAEWARAKNLKYNED